MADVRTQQLGMIGLGQMGLGMTRNLLKKGFRVVGFDLRAEANAACRDAGGSVTPDATTLAQACDVVMTSLVSPAYLKVAADVLLPAAGPGKIFIDWSTVPAPETRRIAAALEACGAVALDAPVTGGQEGAERAALRTFVGGPEEAFRRCLPIFEAVSRPDGVTYGGPAGQGQVLKVVQQLRNRITDAVRLEVIAFGLRDGLSIDQVRRALDVVKGGNDPYARLLDQIEAGRGDELGCLITEWPYYLAEAREKGIPMPALEALYQFCKDGPHVQRDTQGRTGPSVWRELTAPRTKAARGACR